MDNHRYTVAAVEYVNTAIFVNGFRRSSHFSDRFDLVLDYPAGCTRRVMQNEADIGLVPVASLKTIQPAYIFPEYCIGADGPVRTVRLLSNDPLANIRRILLDSHSLTSVRLIRILCERLWNLRPEFVSAGPGFEREKLQAGDALLVIGDKVFSIEDQFSWSYDLAEEWIRLTGTNFVFAVWVSKTLLPDHIIQEFTRALSFGMSLRDEVIQDLENQDQYRSLNMEEYLTRSISYTFDKQKKLGLALFLDYAGLGWDGFKA